jgi:hypothetical protein
VGTTSLLFRRNKHSLQQVLLRISTLGKTSSNNSLSFHYREVPLGMLPKTVPSNHRECHIRNKTLLTLRLNNFNRDQWLHRQARTSTRWIETTQTHLSSLTISRIRILRDSFISNLRWSRSLNCHWLHTHNWSINMEMMWRKSARIMKD